MFQWPDLTEEQIAIQRLARQFADREIRPISAELDASTDLEKSFPWDLVKKGSALGFRTLALPQEYGGLGLDLPTQVVVIDELGYADIVGSKIFSQCWKWSTLIAGVGTEGQKERFLRAFAEDDTYLLAMAQTEPNAGSDNVLPYDDPSAGVMLSAARRDGGYALNGTKHFIAHGPVAKLYTVAARTDRTVGVSKGVSYFLVPRETPGFSVARWHDKVGFRNYPQGELVFDDVRVPAENLLGGKEGADWREEVQPLNISNVELSTHAMALSRAAFDAARQYAKDRVQGGKPIIKHQAVAMMLADMFIDIQTGRNLVWRLAQLAKVMQSDRLLRIATKVFCTEAAVRVCKTAMEIHGGLGIMRELPIQKYIRDALVLPHMDGTNQVNRIRLGALLD
ncbi:MAG: acyl-CoA dehydrogenase family protein [Dehalococcoidia bacterium]